ncbi:MAG: DUF2461 domain-containing protein [Cyclobacteriaceae bacterium]|nr:DUF2461 domain-containing protein [Cyclobacteriaceae bacterium HetDA_MAG_MS6]
MSKLKLNPDTLAFLSDLDQNNNKEWFYENKTRYQKAKDDFEHFVSGRIALLNDKLRLGGVEAKNCIYRIFKDVRFSKDGTLYKTEFGATIAEEGKKTNKAALHLYVKHDGQVFIDTGTCHVEPKDLAKIRSAIDYDSSDFNDFLKSSEYYDLFRGELIGDRVKSTPRGYSVDNKSIELLRYKNFSVRAKLASEELVTDGFEAKVLKIVKAAEPLRNYLNNALNEN